MDSDTEQELEEKNMLRYDLYYLMQKLSRILGFMKVYSVIAKRLEETLNLIKDDQRFHTLKLLAKMEAELYILSGALKKVNENDPETSTAMQQMLELILTLNYPKQKILYTALKIVSRSSAFFGNRADLLQSSFKLLATYINDKKFENICAEAICNLCKNNRGFVQENLSDFVECKIELT
jgi:hypothetical protein